MALAFVLRRDLLPTIRLSGEVDDSWQRASRVGNSRHSEATNIQYGTSTAGFMYLWSGCVYLNQGSARR